MSCSDKTCPCTFTSCKRRTKCCECVAYHKTKKELPACYFSKEKEKTYDRSIDNYINTLTN